jgi:hypothetical protein
VQSGKDIILHYYVQAQPFFKTYIIKPTYKEFEFERCHAMKTSHNHSSRRKSLTIFLTASTTLYPSPIRTRNRRVPPPSPLSLRVAKAGRNHLNEEITPLLSTVMGERYSQTISN